jgi:F-type H+-transporting ATPase subunit epsilon
MSEIRCVVVTPEKTEVDVRASAVTVPLFDGEMGILKGHSPMVGRLGYGILRLQIGGNTEKYFVEAGLVQVRDDVVSVLTDKVLPFAKVTSELAKSATEAAITMPTNQPDQQAARRKAMERARALSRVASTR